jgi:hypothetical protein
MYTYMTIPRILQSLLDSTHLPCDVLEYLIMPFLQSEDVAREKMKEVLKSIRMTRYGCSYCHKHVPFVRKRENQPFYRDTVPYCLKCEPKHLIEWISWVNVHQDLDNDSDEIHSFYYSIVSGVF